MGRSCLFYAGYAASDMVQANPIVSTFWGILFFRVSMHTSTLRPPCACSSVILHCPASWQSIVKTFGLPLEALRTCTTSIASDLNDQNSQSVVDSCAAGVQEDLLVLPLEALRTCTVSIAMVGPGLPEYCQCIDSMAVLQEYRRTSPQAYTTLVSMYCFFIAAGRPQAKLCQWHSAGFMGL